MGASLRLAGTRELSGTATESATAVLLLLRPLLLRTRPSPTATPQLPTSLSSLLVALLLALLPPLLLHLLLSLLLLLLLLLLLPQWPLLPATPTPLLLPLPPMPPTITKSKLSL